MKEYLIERVFISGKSDVEMNVACAWAGRT